VGFALADYFESEPDSGKALFLKYSEKDDPKRFNSKGAERQYDYAKPNKGEPITILTIYQMASHAGANLNDLKRKHLGHKLSFSPVHELGKPNAEDTTPIEKGINYRPNFPYTNGNNKPIATIDNLEIILSQLDCIVRQNVISKEIEIQFRNTKFCTDNAKNAALATLKSEARKFGMASVADVPELIIPISDKNQFNPVLNYITSAPWDGKDRFKELSDTIVSRTCQTLKNELLKTWCLSAVAVATDPDATAQGILVFTGNQGIGKTRWFNSLVPPNLDLTKVGALLKPDDRDSVYQVLKYWLVELGELDATFRKADIAQLKAFITKDTDELRLPYERYTSKWRRRTIFFASVNEERFLVDTTGSRRFWVIDVENIVSDHGIDMQQFWAQMYANYQNGGKHYLDNSTLKLLNKQNTMFTQIDPIEERVATMLDWESPKERWSYKTSVEIAELIDSKHLKSTQLKVMLAKVRELNGNVRIKRKAHMFLCPEKKTISPTFAPTNTDSKVGIQSP
jgi:putative DNA primase/helicase